MIGQCSNPTAELPITKRTPQQKQKQGNFQLNLKLYAVFYAFHSLNHV